MDRGRARGGPSGTKNGHIWSKLWPKLGQIFGHHPGDPYHSGYFVQALEADIFFEVQLNPANFAFRLPHRQS